MNMPTTKQIKAIRTLAKITPPNERNADVILNELLEDAPSELAGQAEEIFQLYKASGDKSSFKRLFRILTGMSFKNYLKKCIETMLLGITQPGKDRRCSWFMKLVFVDKDDDKCQPNELVLITSEKPVHKHEIFSMVDNTRLQLLKHNIPHTAENMTVYLKQHHNLQIRKLDGVLKDIVDEDFVLTCSEE